MAHQWKWLAGPAPRQVTLTAGQPGVIALVFDPAAPRPEVRWALADIPFAKPDAADDARLLLDVPSNEKGFLAVRYTVSDQGSAEREDGVVHVRIQVATRAPEVSTPLVSAPAVPAEAAATPAVPAPAVRAVPASAPAAPAPAAPAPAAPAPAVPTELVPGPVLPDPPLVGRFSVQVVREGVTVRGLRREVIHGTTLLIGRTSRSQGVLPGLDLTGQFGAGDERLCSRRQAEVFWKDGHIVLLSVGSTAAELCLPDGTRTPLQAAHSWRPGQRVIVPGGLELDLRTETGAP